MRARRCWDSPSDGAVSARSTRAPRRARSKTAPFSSIFADAEAFSASHPDGALNIAFGPKVGYWAGWVIPAGARIVLLASDETEATEAARQLLRVGFDSVMGYVEGGASAWEAARLPTARGSRR